MATDRKRIQAYVTDATYFSLEGLARSRGISVSSLVSEILQTTDSMPSSSSVAFNSSDFVTKQELVETVREIYAAMGKLEGRYQAYCESVSSVTAGLLQESLKCLPELLSSDSSGSLSDSPSSGSKSRSRSRKPSA